MNLQRWYVVVPATLFQFVTASVALPAGSGPADWLTIHSPPFVFYYRNGDLGSAEQLASMFRAADSDLTNKSGLKLARPVSVFLAPSQDIFDQLTNHAIPHWGEGVADPVRSVIILKSLSVSSQPERLSRLVRHELTHVLVGQAVKRPEALPKWFNEGMAIHLSADEQFTGGQAISKAIIGDSLIPLDEIDEVLEFHQAKAALAYEESYSFILYLGERFGFHSVVQLIPALNASDTFEQAFKENYDVDLFETELQWYEYVRKKYRWRFLQDVEVYLWIFILVLFIAVVLAIRWRNRRTLRRWDLEERISGAPGERH